MALILVSKHFDTSLTYWKKTQPGGFNLAWWLIEISSSKSPYQMLHLYFPLFIASLHLYSP